MISSGNDEEKGVTPSLTKSNSKHLSLHRHVSTVINTYIGDLESSDRIKFDPSSTSENDLEHLIDQVLESYKDENGNVLQREIIRDALLSNMEKFKQHAENSHLTKEIKRIEVASKKRSMWYNISIFFLVIASTISIYFAVSNSMATGTEQVKETIEGTVVTLS